MNNLELGAIGNASVAALLDEAGDIVWGCLPRLDSDAVFCSLLRERKGADDFGFLSVELADLARTDQYYIPSTPVLVTRLPGTGVQATGFWGWVGGEGSAAAAISARAGGTFVRLRPSRWWPSVRDGGRLDDDIAAYEDG